MYKKVVLVGQVVNPRLVAFDAIPSQQKVPGRVRKIQRFDASKHVYACELEGQTVFLPYVETRPLSTKHEIAVAGKYDRDGTFICDAFINLTTGFQHDPRDVFLSMGRMVGGFPVIWAFCIWQIVKGVGDPFILAINWFLVVFIGISGLFFFSIYLSGSASMKALKHHLNARK
jgi:hypothetical protein